MINSKQGDLIEHSEMLLNNSQQFSYKNIFKMLFSNAFCARHSVCSLHCDSKLHILMARIFPLLLFCATIFSSKSQIVGNAPPAIEYENVLTQDGYHFRQWRLVTFLAGWADILILPSTNVIIVITCYIFCYVCCNCWKGISVLVTANCSVQQEPTGRSRKSLAGKGIRKCYLLLWK
jgi:hypothetical protein